MIAHPFERFFSEFIFLLLLKLCVIPSINLNDKSAITRNKVHYIITNYMLPKKLYP